MPRLNPIDPNQTEGKAKALLDGVQKALGMAPNIVRTMANSPATLEGFLAFSRALNGGSLSRKLREVIALAVASLNDCRYCVAVHTAVSKRLGVDDAELARNRDGRSSDPKIEAGLQFAYAIVEKRGWVSDDDLQRVRDAGYGDGEIVDIIATVGLNIFSNYFDHVAQTDVDFPMVD